MLTATELGKRYGPRWIFRQIDLTLNVGDALAVLGPNGCGKSTLLKILAGLIAATEGLVTRSEPGVGYAAPDLQLYPLLTGAEHLALAADLRGLDDARLDLLERFGLSGAADQLTSTYSTGMRLRLKLALALQARPPLLLLDEPTATLDKAGRQAVAEIVAEQRERGTIVLATNDPHDLALANLKLNLA